MKKLSVIAFIIFLASCSQQNDRANILLNGEPEVTIMVGTNYEDLGVVAIEGESFLEVVVEGQVDTNLPGVYIILYEATDSSGNKLSLTRKVTVVSELQGFEDISTCDNPNGNDPCWNEDSQSYLFEPDAKIVIGVDNSLIGEIILSQWRKDYPNYSNLLEFIDYSSQNLLGAGVQGIVSGAELPDVALVSASNVVGYEDYFYMFDDRLAELIATHVTKESYSLYNQNGAFVSPAYWDGMVFSWNETMLSSFGVDVVTDSDNDGLPDAFDTWEEIFELDLVGRTYNGKRINEAFPIVLNEAYSAYSSLTAGGFKIYEDGFKYPGFNSPEFIEGLRFIQQFSSKGLNQDAEGNLLTGNKLDWRWDEYLGQEAYPFGLIGTWMNTPMAARQSGSVFRISKMPTFQGNQLRPLANNKGYVINGSTEYPSSAHEVVRWLNNKETVKLITSETNLIPVLSRQSDEITSSFTRLQKEFVIAMRESQLEPRVPLEGTINTDAFNAYYLIGIEEILRDLWNGTVSPEIAQQQIVQASNAWLSNNVN